MSMLANVCHTNTTSNTAFRGSGGPQGMIICEAYMDHVARHLKCAPRSVRIMNLYGRTKDILSK